MKYEVSEKMLASFAPGSLIFTTKYVVLDGKRLVPDTPIFIISSDLYDDRYIYVELIVGFDIHGIYLSEDTLGYFCTHA